jgi:hypothetical protein
MNGAEKGKMTGLKIVRDRMLIIRKNCTGPEIKQTFGETIKGKYYSSFLARKRHQILVS